MANFSDLRQITSARINAQQWFDRQDSSHKAMLLQALADYPAAKVHRIISRLDTDPFPFTEGTLRELRRKLLEKTEA